MREHQRMRGSEWCAEIEDLSCHLHGASSIKTRKQDAKDTVQ